MDISPIGRMRTPFSHSYEAPNQGYKAGAAGTIELEAQYAPGASDLSAGETVLVLWWAADADRSVLTVDRAGGKSVFATRSPARPNPVCITPVRITSIDGNEIAVVGVDMVDGSPVLDIKPPIDRYGPWETYEDLRRGYEEAEE